ncbi:hypothetical protein B1R32_11339 [Abditibacterium utsteinense]|uniref:Uncharacterized protein n=1 Tax=Abditibacterium utsteinense TaxID=1960156 RepID=A0A2S8SR70_9BACT|nr:DUF6785 family protein [Abditibacterium utsteinense]PQV63312.1 hypothetical protein B1R32_11339 [Abditibacterium utsteinense]
MVEKLDGPGQPKIGATISEEAAPLAGRERGVTPRVVVICLLLAVVLGYIIPIIDFKVFNTFLGATHLPPGAIGALLVLVLVVNPLLRSISKRLSFSRNETLTVYISCLFSSLIPGHGAENLALPVSIAPFYFATRENKWLEWIQPYLKPWLSPALDLKTGAYNKSIVDGWYNGLAPGESIPWGAWLVPVAVWGGLILMIYIMLACLSVMLRAQWADREALAFPLLRLPLVMTEDLDRKDDYATLGRFFRNPLMWVGFGIATFIQLQRGLHLYFPDVPNFPLELDLNSILTEAPFNQIGWVPINIYPMVVGITYLLTSEVSFSLWFFFLFMKIQLMGAYYIGFMPSILPDAGGAFPGKMFQGFQVGGAYIAYVGIALWTAREHLKHIVRRGFGRARATPEERQEVLSYPLAFWGFTLTFCVLVGVSMLAGVRFDIALALWVSYIILAIGLTRVAVEGGMLFLLHDIQPLGAIARLLTAGPSQWLTPENGLVPASFLQSGLVYHLRGFSMPSFMHSFKLAHDHKISPRPLMALISVVILISLSMSLWGVIRLGYENGGMSLTSSWAREHLAVRPATFIDSVTKDNGSSLSTNWISLAVGAILTYGMMLARSRFAWFPFHPIGYLMCLTYAAAMFWFSIFLGWGFKRLITRFGGHETYRNLLPMFLGLVLGDVVMILFWLVIDGWQGRIAHQLMPG